jgi:Na+-driven multidrug efflux pump
LVPPATSYIHIVAIALPLEALRACSSSYLYTQNVVRPLALVAFLTAAATPALNHTFIYALGWGLSGAAVAAIGVQMLTVVLLVLVMVWHNRS